QDRRLGVVAELHLGLGDLRHGEDRALDRAGDEAQVPRSEVEAEAGPGHQRDSGWRDSAWRDSALSRSLSRSSFACCAHSVSGYLFRTISRMSCASIVRGCLPAM